MNHRATELSERLKPIGKGIVLALSRSRDRVDADTSEIETSGCRPAIDRVAAVKDIEIGPEITGIG